MEKKEVEQNSNNNDLSASLFEAISHPRRIQILKLLKDNEYKFSQLKKKMGIKSSGNMTHHLNKLDKLVRINERGYYKITIQGKKALYAVDAVNETNRKGIIKLYLSLSGAIFYIFYMVILHYIDNLDIYYPFIPLIGVPFTFVFVFILNFFFKKRIKEENWDIIWSGGIISPNKK